VFPGRSGVFGIGQFVAAGDEEREFPPLSAHDGAFTVEEISNTDENGEKYDNQQPVGESICSNENTVCFTVTAYPTILHEYGIIY